MERYIRRVVALDAPFAEQLNDIKFEDRKIVDFR